MTDETTKNGPDAAAAEAAADAAANVPRWRAIRVEPDAMIEFPRSVSGVWIYVAVEGGFDAPRWFGSASVCARAGIGTAFHAGDVAQGARHKPFALPAGVAARVAPAIEQRDYRQPPALRVWPAPQMGLFSSDPEALAALKRLDPDALSPREALDALYRLKALL